MHSQLPNQEQFLDLYRNGIRSASDIGQAWLQVSLRLHEKQLETVRGMMDENKRSAERLGEARSLQDLASVQSQIYGTQLRRVSELWTSLWQAAAENQQTIIGQVRPFAARTSDSTAEDAARAAANQVSRGAGSIRESAPHSGKEHRKSA
jgi:hypothetical protein